MTPLRHLADLAAAILAGTIVLLVPFHACGWWWR